MTEADGEGTRWAKGLVGAALVLAAARASESLAVRRWTNIVPPFDTADFEMPGVGHRLTASDGGTINVMVAGQGPTIVLGHGIAGHLGHWAPVARQLVDRGCRVVVFDQRGHGASVAGTLGFGLAGLAADLAAVIEDLGGDDVTVGGHSMGGIGIQAMVRYRPDLLERVRGVALVATTPKAIENPATKVLGTDAGFRVYRRLLQSETQARVLMRGGFGSRPSIEQIDFLCRSWDQTPDDTLRALADGLDGFDLTAEAGLLDKLTIVVCGDRDQVTPLKMSQSLVSCLPRAELEVAKGARHMVIWERPDLITETLAGLSLS